MKWPFVDLGVVTRAAPVLGVCAAVLRDVTVLSLPKKSSPGYELASLGFVECRASQTSRLRASPLTCAAAYYGDLVSCAAFHSQIRSQHIPPRLRS